MRPISESSQPALSKMIFLVAFCFCLTAGLSSHAVGLEGDTLHGGVTSAATATVKERELFNEANALMKLNNNIKAAEILGPLSQNNNISVIINYGVVLIRLGKIQSAIEALSRARSLAPGSYPALFYLCQALSTAGRTDEAIMALRQYSKDFPKSSQILQVESDLTKLGKEKAWQESLSKEAKDNYLVEFSSPARWVKDDLPISVHIADGGDAEELKEAFLQWQNASNGKLKFKFVKQAAQAKIHCAWTADRATLDSPLEGGETLVSKSQDAKMLGAEIRILISDDPLERRAAALHEVGHSLGMGHSTRPGDAMFFAYNSDAFDGSLSSRDKRTIAQLYSRTPEALARMQNGDRTEVAESGSALQSAIELNKKAAAFFASGSYAEAAELLQKSDELAPNTKTIQENLARAYLKLADRECLSQSFAEAESHLNLAAKYFAKCRKIDEARSVYKDLSALAKGLKKDADAQLYLQKAEQLTDFEDNRSGSTSGK